MQTTIMSNALHEYNLTVTWTGNDGTGTSSYDGYQRDHEISAPGLPTLEGSSDPQFRGDPTRWNPEQLLVASLSQCHMLWYLGIASKKGVAVTKYVDNPTGTMVTHRDGSGEFTTVTLRPVVTVTDESMQRRAQTIHSDAHAMCFIARSMNFPIGHEPTVEVA